MWNQHVLGPNHFFNTQLVAVVSLVLILYAIQLAIGSTMRLDPPQTRYSNPTYLSTYPHECMYDHVQHKTGKLHSTAITMYTERYLQCSNFRRGSVTRQSYQSSSN